jgi:hypothetical protein
VVFSCSEEGEKMIRGTTPKLEFTLPFEVATLTDCYVTLAQNDTVLVEKCMTDCQCDGKTLVARLTQEETLKLDCDCNTEIQIRAKTTMGEAIASDIFMVDTGRILKDGVI